MDTNETLYKQRWFSGSGSTFICQHTTSKQAVSSLSYFMLHYNEFSFMYIFRPADRSIADISVIVSHLRHLAALTGVPPPLLHQLAACAYFEQLDSGVTCKLMQLR